GHDEILRLLEAAAAIPADPRSPLRHRVLPAIFRVLYGCGPRIGEVVSLRVGEVDLISGILVVREGKDRKDRLVPMMPSLGNTSGAMRTPWASAPPMSPSSPPRWVGLTSVRRSTTPSANFSGDVRSPTEDEGTVPGSTTFVIHSRCTAWPGGIARE